MTTINQALDDVRSKVNKRVGNGQCYGLVSYYEQLITPNSTVGLGAGVGGISGAVGDTLNAHAIGTAYNWSANGWTVVRPTSASQIKVGGIINIKAYQGEPFHTLQWGHTAIITAVNGSSVTLHEQNTYGREWVVEQVYALNQTFINGVSTIVYPPGIGNATGPSVASGKLRDEFGTMTVTVDQLNVRDQPSLSGKVVADYKIGQSLKYDSVYVGDGHIWVSYIGGSGKRRYVAAGVAQGTHNIRPYGTFK